MNRRDKQTIIAEALLEDWAHTKDRYRMMNGPLRKAAYVIGQATQTALYGTGRIASYAANRPDWAKTEDEYLEKLDDNSPMRRKTLGTIAAINQSPVWRSRARRKREAHRLAMSPSDRHAHDKYMRDNRERLEKLRNPNK